MKILAICTGLSVGFALWPAAFPWRLVLPDTSKARPSTRQARVSASPTPPGARQSVAASADLLAVALVSGASVHEAVLAIGLHAESRMSHVASRIKRGEPIAVALESLDSGQPGWRSLSMLLAVSASSGAPAADALRRLAASERSRERRRIERQVRKLPVLLLLPTAFGVLPAFALVTLVPLLIGTAKTLM